MKRIIPLFFLVAIFTCETQGFFNLVFSDSNCCMTIECTPEKKKDCEESGNMPLCCRICGIACIYIVPERISITSEEPLKEKIFVFNEPLFSFYQFDTFHPPEFYV